MNLVEQEKLQTQAVLQELNTIGQLDCTVTHFHEMFKASQQLILAGCTMFDQDIFKNSLGQDLNKGQNRLCFEWSADFRTYLMLLRDGMLNLQKLKAFQLDEINEPNREAYESKLTDEVHRATSSLSKTLEHIHKLDLDEVDLEKDATYYFERTPIVELLKDYQRLSAQNDQINRAFIQQDSIHRSFNSYKGQFRSFINERKTHLDELRQDLEKLEAVIISNQNEVDEKAVQLLLKQYNESYQHLEDNKYIRPYSNLILGQIQLDKFPIKSSGPDLVQKSIALTDYINGWFSEKILPDLMAVDSALSKLQQDTLLTLFNSKNRLEGISLEKAEVYRVPHDLLLQSVQKSRNQVELLLKQHEGEINERINYLDNALKVSNIYDERHVIFPDYNADSYEYADLEIYSIRQSWSMRWKEIKKRVMNFFNQRVRRYSLSATDFINAQLIHESPNDPWSIFLRKGYIGSSFMVERKSINARLTKAVDEWKNGFQGSLLVYGRYGSGKSAILQSVGQLLTNEHVINLQPNTDLYLDGEVIDIKYNLGVALKHIAKASLREKKMVIIDDLELWHDQSNTVFPAIKDLLQTIESAGKRIFFVVSCNKYMYEHSEKLFNWNDYFLDTLSTDYMSRQNIERAMFIRYNTTFKEEAGEQREALRMMQRSLHRWRFQSLPIGSYMLLAYRLLRSPSHDWVRDLHVIPNSFRELVEQNRVFLWYLLRVKRIDEQQFRRSLHAEASSRMSAEIQKLIGLKVLMRNIHAELYINPDLIFQIEEILIKAENS